MTKSGVIVRSEATWQSNPLITHLPSYLITIYTN